LVPQNTNFKKIVHLLGLAFQLLLFFKPAQAGYTSYTMQANETQIFELTDFYRRDSTEVAYHILNKSPLQVKLLSSKKVEKNNGMFHQIIRLEMKTPKLWFPKTYYFKIKSQSKKYPKDFDVFVEVNLTRNQWLLYGLVVLLSCVILFGSIYYFFSKKNQKLHGRKSTQSYN